MKLSKVSILILSSFALLQTSCVDETDNNFELQISGFILQEGDGNAKVYTPYYYFSSNSLDYKLSSVEIMKSGSGDNLLSAVKFSDYIFFAADTLQLKTPTELNGNYYLVGKTTTGLSSQKQLTLEYAETDTLSPIVLDNFAYDGKKISITINEVPEAYKIGLILTAFNEGETPKRYSDAYYTLATMPSWINGKVSLSMSFSSEMNLMADYAAVKVFVSNTNSVYRESEAKIMTKDGTNWVK